MDSHLTFGNKGRDSTHLAESQLQHSSYPYPQTDRSPNSCL